MDILQRNVGCPFDKEKMENRYNLEIKNLTKQYGSFLALDHLNATFSLGIYGILGANGAGKSTFMNLISDNISRTDGEILFCGTDILTLGKKFRSILGYMPQQQGFYETMSARSFLSYMAKLKGVSYHMAENQINKLFVILNLQDMQHKRILDLSHGMRQRILLAQALLGTPQVLLLDEPTAGLDPQERIRLRKFIAKIAQKRIVLITTHVVSDVESIASKILIMKEGKLICMDHPEKLIGELRCKNVHPVGAELSLEDVYLYYNSNRFT